MTMSRPHVAVVALLCAAAFLGALVAARASDSGGAAPASAPAPIAAADTVADVPGLGHAAPLPQAGRKRQVASPAPAPAPTPASTRRAPATPKRAPAPSPAPAPAPKLPPKPNQGTPFLDVH